LDEEQYLVPIPLVGEDFIHQPFIVFGVAEVVVGVNFVSWKYFVVITEVVTKF
jgi:hypothetical protein